MFIFCISDKEFFLDDVRDPFEPAPDIFLRDFVVDGVAEDRATEFNADLSSECGDLIDLVNVPFAPTPPPNDDDAEVDVVPEMTIDPGFVPGGGGNIIEFTAGFILAGGRPRKISVSAEAITGVAVVVDI